jgi:cbb3-type cytochrome oxidase maturation protein
MYAIFVLIIISLIVAIGFLVTFVWAVKNNQYEDDYTPSVRILFDDEVKKDAAKEE